MVTARNVIVALPDLLGSASLVAITATEVSLGMGDGARYTPSSEILPTAGSSDHRTSVLEPPLTIAPNLTVSPPVSVAVSGPTATENSDGRSATSAVAALPG